MQGGGQVRAVADQGQVDAGEGIQLQEAFGTAGGETVCAKDGQPVHGQGGHPCSSGFPGGLTAGGETAWEQRRFAQGGQKVVGKPGFAGGARTGVQGDPAGQQVVGGQGGVRVDRVVAWVEDHGDGRWHGRRRGGQARRLKAQRSSSWSTRGRPGQGGAGVGGQLRPRAEIAVRGVAVGEGDVVGVGVCPDRVEQGNGLQDLAGGEAGEVLPDEDAGGEHRLAAQHGVAALPADEDDASWVEGSSHR